MQTDQMVIDGIGQQLMALQSVELKPENSTLAPTTPGVYAIHNNAGECLWVGRSGNLRNRIFTQHYSQGSDHHAGSDLVYVVQLQRVCDQNKSAAQKWIRENCVVRWIALPDAEKELRAHLKPIWGKR